MGYIYKKVLAKMEWFKLKTPTEPKLFIFPIDIKCLLIFGPYIIFTINLAKMEWFKLRTPTEPKLFIFPIDIKCL